MTHIHATLERQLREKIRELLAAVRFIGEEKGPLVRDLLDAASLEQEVEPLIVTLRTAEIHEIDQAIRRVKAGTYRRCSECGGDIGAKRLKAIPWTKTCLLCKEREEQGIPRPMLLGRPLPAGRTV